MLNISIRLQEVKTNQKSASSNLARVIVIEGGIVILNYIAFTRPSGQCFSFHAENDSEAKVLLTDFLRESDQFYASIHPWNSEKKDYDFSKTLEVELEEKARAQNVEYKVVTRYVKWISFSGLATESKFEDSAETAAKAMDVLPEQPGWEKSFFSSKVHRTDDDRYGVTPIEIAL